MRIFLLAALLATAAHAETFQDLAQIDAQVAATVGAPAGQPGGAQAPVDRRLKLAACPGFTVDPPMMNAVSVRCPASGWRIRVPLLADGQVSANAAAPSAKKAPPVIHRGDPVQLVADAGDFSVSTEVTAEQDGAPGEHIRVRVDPKSPPRMAEVVDSGTVRLPGFK